MKSDYTVEVFKKDARCKNGEKMYIKIDYESVMKDGIEKYCEQNYPAPKFRFEIFDTWVTKRNLLSGVEFKERYDTPHYCSPSSESYWSM